MPTEEELDILSRKLNQLKLAYEQYFLGSRPREPMRERDEVQKLVLVYSNTAIQNTALRFKFNSINSRYQAFKRQWTDTLRKMEAGTYQRHRFKAKLHGLDGGKSAAPSETPATPPPNSRDDIYAAYVEAREACGQSTANLTQGKLDVILKKQEDALRKRYGDAEVNFRVVVENGKAKLKARKA